MAGKKKGKVTADAGGVAPGAAGAGKGAAALARGRGKGRGRGAAAAAAGAQVARKAAKPSKLRKTGLALGKAGLALAVGVGLEATKRTTSKKTANIAAGGIAAAGLLAEVLADGPVAEIGGTVAQAAIASQLADAVCDFGFKMLGIKDAESQRATDAFDDEFNRQVNGEVNGDARGLYDGERQVAYATNRQERGA